MFRLIQILFLSVGASLSFSGSGERLPSPSLVQPRATPPATVRDEHRLRNCECPQIEVTSDLIEVKSGDKIRFRVSIFDTELQISRFDWKVENGTIVSGQGTDEILVRSKKMGDAEFVKASVLLPVYSTMCVCPITFEEEVLFGDESLEAEHAGEIVCYVASVKALELDRQEFTIPCSVRDETSQRELFLSSDVFIVYVKTIGVDPDGDHLTYSYAVSAGKIIGEGPSVQWDLTDVGPGKYSITAAVDDGCGFCGDTVTKIVTIKTCPTN